MFDRYFDSVTNLSVSERDRSVFSPEFLGLADSQESPDEIFRSYLQKAPAKDSLSQLLYLDTKTYLPGDILTKVDRMSMATSLEVRAPLLDHVFVEWVAQLPAHWKYRAGQAKYLLKKLAERVGVPPQVLHRPKRGFAVPLVHWLRKELRQELVEILLEPRTLQRGYLSPAGVRQLVDEHLGGRRDRSSQIWMLLVFELWLRNFLEPHTRQPERLAPSLKAVPEVVATTGP